MMKGAEGAPAVAPSAGDDFVAAAAAAFAVARVRLWLPHFRIAAALKDDGRCMKSHAGPIASVATFGARLAQVWRKFGALGHWGTGATFGQGGASWGNAGARLRLEHRGTLG